VSYSHLPLHYVGQSTATLTYRNRGEVIDESWKKSMLQKQSGEGLATSGEFGSVLITVVADALKGKITWARWEEINGERAAVFHYDVPAEKSNYHVQFCCIVNGISSSGQPNRSVFDEKSGYSGDIAFNPSDGTIWRISIQASLPGSGLVPSAGMIVEYGPEELGGQTYICPHRSVSLIMAHTTQQPAMQSRSNYKGPLKTFLNDVKFTGYRRFGSEARILPATE